MSIEAEGKDDSTTGNMRTRRVESTGATKAETEAEAEFVLEEEVVPFHLFVKMGQEEAYFLFQPYCGSL
jgi:hypothetical protein